MLVISQLRSREESVPEAFSGNLEISEIPGLVTEPVLKYNVETE